MILFLSNHYVLSGPKVSVSVSAIECLNSFDRRRNILTDSIFRDDHFELVSLFSIRRTVSLSEPSENTKSDNTIFEVLWECGGCHSDLRLRDGIVV